MRWAYPTRAALQSTVSSVAPNSDDKYAPCNECFLPTPVAGLSEDGLCSGCDPEAKRISHRPHDYHLAARMNLRKRDV